MALVKGNARSSSALDATVLTGNLPAISGASLTGIATTQDHELVSNTTISSAGHVDITTAFTNTAYTNFYILGSGINMANDNNDFRFNFIHNNGGIVGDTNYYWTGAGQRDASAAVDFGASGVSYGRVIDNSASTGQAINFDMTVTKPFISGHYTSFFSHAGGRRSGGGANQVSVGGYINTTDQMKGIRFLMSSGNISAGNILVFGMRDS